MIELTKSSITLDNLLKNFKTNNEECVTELYLQLKKPLFIFCLSIVNDYYAAEDILHDTFIKVINNAKSYKNGSNAKAWIFTIARNTALNYINKSKNEIIQDNIEFNEAIHFTEEIESSMEFLNLIKDLEESEKEILALRLGADLDYKTIAKTLNISSVSARKRYSRAVKNLKNTLGK